MATCSVCGRGIYFLGSTALMQAYRRHQSSVRPQVGRRTWALSMPLPSMFAHVTIPLDFEGKPEARKSQTTKLQATTPGSVMAIIDSSRSADSTAFRPTSREETSFRDV